MNVKGDVDPVTGMVIDLKHLKDIIKEDVENLLDHKNLNIEIKYFEEVVPTAENICIFIWNILRNKIDSDKDISVTLFETPRNYVEYSGN